MSADLILAQIESLRLLINLVGSCTIIIAKSISLLSILSNDPYLGFAELKLHFELVTRQVSSSFLRPVGLFY